MKIQSTFFVLLLGNVCAVWLGGSALLKAQNSSNSSNFSYRFDYEQRGYTALERGTSLLTNVWDDPTITIQFDFAFKFFERSVHELYIIQTTQGLVLVADSNRHKIQPVVLLSQMDLADRGMAHSLQSSGNSSVSPITWHVSGDVGNRDIVLQFENVGFAQDIKSDSASSDFINFQVIFHETSSNMSIHFGPSHITQPNLIYRNQTGVALGIIPAIDLANQQALAPGIWLEGYPNIPMSAVSMAPKYLQGTIPNGMMYHILRSEYQVTTSVDATLEALRVYPQPAQDMLFVQGLTQGAEATILNMQGKEVLHQHVSPQEAISLSELPAGYYLLRLTSGQVFWQTQIIKE